MCWLSTSSWPNSLTWINASDVWIDFNKMEKWSLECILDHHIGWRTLGMQNVYFYKQQVDYCLQLRLRRGKSKWNLNHLNLHSGLVSVANGFRICQVDFGRRNPIECWQRNVFLFCQRSRFHFSAARFYLRDVLPFGRISWFIYHFKVD